MRGDPQHEAWFEIFGLPRNCVREQQVTEEINGNRNSSSHGV